MGGKSAKVKFQLTELTHSRLPIIIITGERAMKTKWSIGISLLASFLSDDVPLSNLLQSTLVHRF